MALAPRHAGRVRFAGVGDTHFADPPAPAGEAAAHRRSSGTLDFYAEVTRTTWPRIAAQIRAAAPDFAIQAGDLVNGDWTDAEAAQADLRAALRRLEALGCPVLVTQGNHDRSPAPIAVPAWRDVVLPWIAHQWGWSRSPDHEHYLADVGDCRIVVLDPTLQPGDAQHAWLRRALAEPGPRRRFVAGHYPVVPLGRPAFAPFHTATTLGPDLAAARVDAYLCAHTHNQTVSVHHYPTGPLLQVTGSPVGVLPGTPHRFGTGVVPLQDARPLAAGPHPCDYLWGFLEDTAPGWYLIDADPDGVTLTWHTAAESAGDPPARAGWQQPGLVADVSPPQPPPSSARPTATDLARARAARLRVAGHGAPAGMPVRLNGAPIGALPALGSFAPGPVLELPPNCLGLLGLENEVELTTPPDAALLVGAILLELDLEDGTRRRTRPSPRLWTTMPAASGRPPSGLDLWLAPTVPTVPAVSAAPGTDSWFGEHLTRITPGDTIRAAPLVF